MEKIKKIITVVPFIIYMTIFYLYGIFYGAMSSVGYNRIVGESKFTLNYYRDIFLDKGFHQAVFFTLKIAFFSGGIAVLLSVIVLYYIYINIKEKYMYPRFFQKLVELPLLVPYLIGGYAIFVCFMQSGLFSKILIYLGTINNYQEFPILTNDKRGIGIMMTYVWKSIPFIVMTVTPIIVKVVNKWDNLSKVYNLSNRSFYIKIVIPLITPTLVMSFFMVFSYFLVSFEVPYLLGVTNPKSIAVYIFDLYRRKALDERGVVMAMNILILTVNILVGLIMYGIFKKYSKYDEKGWE